MEERSKSDLHFRRTIWLLGWKEAKRGNGESWMTNLEVIRITQDRTGGRNHCPRRVMVSLWVCVEGLPTGFTDEPNVDVKE